MVKVSCGSPVLSTTTCESQLLEIAWTGLFTNVDAKNKKNDKITIITERTEREIITLRDYLQQEKEIILEATGKIKDPKERKDFLLTTRSDNITEILKLESDAAVNEEQKETLKGHLDKLWET